MAARTKIRLTAKERSYLRGFFGKDPNVHVEFRDPDLGASGGYVVYLDDIAIGVVERYTLLRDRVFTTDRRGWVAHRSSLEGTWTDRLGARGYPYVFHSRGIAIKKLIELAPSPRERALHRVGKGESATAVARSMGINEKTMHSWVWRAKRARRQMTPEEIAEAVDRVGAGESAAAVGRSLDPPRTTATICKHARAAGIELKRGRPGGQGKRSEADRQAVEEAAAACTAVIKQHRVMRVAAGRSLEGE